MKKPANLPFRQTVGRRIPGTGRFRHERGYNQIEVEDGNIPGNKLYFNVNLALDPLRKKMK